MYVGLSSVTAGGGWDTYLRTNPFSCLCLSLVKIEDVKTLFHNFKTETNGGDEDTVTLLAYINCMHHLMLHVRSQVAEGLAECLLLSSVFCNQHTSVSAEGRGEGRGGRGGRVPGS